ncbi:MAG: ROK family protein [Candidatus Marinimicrobia bacterium]|nr:ROK family protein [Candidatus Neomarinimicrobiota bacterium]
MQDKIVIGVDLGGTNVAVGRINGMEMEQLEKKLISARDKNQETVLHEVIETIEKVYNDQVDGIGIGVPSLVDGEKGIVYDVQNIPSWKEVHLKEILQQRFKVPVFIGNDANCFAAGEKFFGKAREVENFVGLVIGTGMGAGVFINGHLYTGQNCGAGEFGMLPYKDKIFESYCSGQYFVENYKIKGEELYHRAKNGDSEALQIFNEFGKNLGVGITAILYALDPEMIIIGGSVSQSFEFFQKRMWDQLQGFAYSHVLKKLKIEVSEKSNIAVFGAAGLYYNAQ